ncbi:MAG: hypothetical protein ABIC68_05965 [Candidatus Omnitrophota bacterium]
MIISNLFFESFMPVCLAFLGVLIGGLFTLKGVEKAHELDLKRERSAEKKLIDSFLQMIRTELEAIWSQYQISMGRQVEALKEDQPLLVIFPVAGNYFSVYENNTNLLGRVKEENLRELIVIVYIKAKAMLDAFKLNNEMIKEFEKFSRVSQNETDKTIKAFSDARLISLKEYAALIKKGHKEFKDSIQTLIGRLKKLLEN